MWSVGAKVSTILCTSLLLVDIWWYCACVTTLSLWCHCRTKLVFVPGLLVSPAVSLLPYVVMSAVLSAVQLFSQCSLLVMSSFCCVSSLSVLLYLAWFLWLVHVISFIMRFWWQCPCGDITWCKCVSGPISLGIITHDIKDISSRLNLATLVEVSDRLIVSKKYTNPLPYFISKQ